jgi:hypothetical protein
MAKTQGTAITLLLSRLREGNSKFIKLKHRFYRIHDRINILDDMFQEHCKSQYYQDCQRQRRNCKARLNYWKRTLQQLDKQLIQLTKENNKIQILIDRIRNGEDPMLVLLLQDYDE